ncbi:MAG: 16S rRNA (uracil(1498)-N(3))-methyltransferase [Brevundimonas sp.]
MIRLHVTADLSAGAAVVPTLDQSRYLTQVMRLGAGDALRLFNGRDGEWRATVAEVLKKGVVLRAEARVRDQIAPPDVELLLATVKKSALEFAVEKATELGTARIRLITTVRTQPQHLRLDRLDAIAEESAEQTGRLDVPAVDDPVKLTALLDRWDPARRIMFCDETGGPPAIAALTDAGPRPWAILIGPQGGVAPEERDRLRAMDCAVPLSLGPRILRADTAAVTALSLWQATLGDWKR